MENKFYFETSPITEEEKPLVYSKYYLVPEPTNCIGHLRGYLDNQGNLPTTWFDHDANLKTPWFHEQFNALFYWLHKGILKDRKSLVSFINGYGNALPLTDDDFFPPVGIKVITDQFSYYIRLRPDRGDYNVYIYCYTNTVERPDPNLEIVKVTPRKPWQGAYRVYTYGVHEATFDTLEQAQEYAANLLEIWNNDNIIGKYAEGKEEEE